MSSLKGAHVPRQEFETHHYKDLKSILKHHILGGPIQSNRRFQRFTSFEVSGLGCHMSCYVNNTSIAHNYHRSPSSYLRVRILYCINYYENINVALSATEKTQPLCRQKSHSTL